MFSISCTFTFDCLFNDSILNTYEIFLVALILYIERYTFMHARHKVGFQRTINSPLDLFYRQLSKTFQRQ